jgi:hypothetical protein
MLLARLLPPFFSNFLRYNSIFRLLDPSAGEHLIIDADLRVSPDNCRMTAK